MNKLVIRAVFIVILLYVCRQSYLVISHEQIAGDDFRCYYTTAWMVRTHQSASVYLASGDTDPTFDLNRVKPDTAFARTAAAHNIHFGGEVLPYTYPLTLADLMVPLTFLSPSTAFLLWTLASAAALFWAAVLMVRMPEMGLSGQLLPVLAFLLFRPTLDGFVWGQVVMLLFLSLVAGIMLYLRGNTYAAAFLLALPMTIKLTPLILLVPLVAWRDWKMLRAVILWCVAIAAAVLMINGTSWIGLYVFHELRTIGVKFDVGSRSIGTALQVLWTRTDRGITLPILTTIGKLISTVMVAYAAWQSRSDGAQSPTGRFKLESLAGFLLLSSCISPVAWMHGYLAGAPALLIVGKRIWDEQGGTFESIVFLLLICSLATNTMSALMILTPVLTLVLVAMGFQRLRQPQNEVSRRLVPIGS